MFYRCCRWDPRGGQRGVALVGPQLKAMFDAFDAVDVTEAYRINQRPAAVVRLRVHARRSQPPKAMLWTLGLPAGECRPPMGPTPDGLEVQAKELWDAPQS